MSRIRNTLILSSATLTLLAAGLHLQAQPGNEAYYSTNIDDAVAHAKHNPVDKRYVGKTWYNRSTSQSFDFPKMLNSEMNNQVIEGAVGATAAGDQRDTVVEESVVETNLGRKINELDETNNVNSVAATTPDAIQQIESSTNEVFVREINYSDAGFSGSARNIRSEVTITAQER